LAVVGVLQRACKFPSCVGAAVGAGAVPALLSRMVDDSASPDIRAAAVTALADVVRQAPPSSSSSSPSSDGTGAELAPLVDPPALAALNRLLSAGSGSVRAAAAKLLWQLAYRNYGTDIAASG
jgi:hypothetical protein